MDKARPRYRLIEHTADMGVMVRGPTLAAALEDAAFALTELMVEAGTVRAVRSLQVSLREESAERLLVRWLTELLYLFETRRFLGAQFAISCTGQTGLDATVSGEDFDAMRHHFKSEVKAVTYHRLRVEPTARGWRAFFIVDL
jgi:SHS2 domain-containing protein